MSSTEAKAVSSMTFLSSSFICLLSSQCICSSCSLSLSLFSSTRSCVPSTGLDHILIPFRSHRDQMSHVPFRWVPSRSPRTILSSDAIRCAHHLSLSLSFFLFLLLSFAMAQLGINLSIRLCLSHLLHFF